MSILWVTMAIATGLSLISQTNESLADTGITVIDKALHCGFRELQGENMLPVFSDSEADFYRAGTAIALTMVNSFNIVTVRIQNKSGIVSGMVGSFGGGAVITSAMI